MPSATNRGNQVWARGQEYDRVYIDPDVAASLSRPEALLTSAFGDEANIAYVGFTRAIRELHLPRDFKTILTPEWQEAIERYEPVQVSRISKASLPQNRIPLPLVGRGKVRGEISKPSPPFPGTRSGEFTTEVDLPKPPRKKPFKVGDRPALARPTSP